MNTIRSLTVLALVSLLGCHRVHINPSGGAGPDAGGGGDADGGRDPDAGADPGVPQDGGADGTLRPDADVGSDLGSGVGVGADGGGVGGLGVGHVGFRLAADHHVYRLSAADPPLLEDVTALLDKVTAGEDTSISFATDGSWVGVTTTRAGCDYECLALFPIESDLLQPAKIAALKSGTDFIHPNDRPAIAAQAALVVYSASGSPHARDLFVIRKSGAGWSPPQLLTSASTFAYNLLPTLTRDERAVVFDCSVAGGADYLSQCQVNLDGSGFQVLVASTDGAGATAKNEVHSGSYDPSGALIFETDWNGERIWRKTAAGVLEQVGDYSNDNTPCLLPDGRIISLWEARPGGNGIHELKVMSNDGSSYRMLLPDRDVVDSGLACSP